MSDFESAAPRYTTRQDAIDQEILPALGDYAEDHDVDAIFDETYAWKIDTNERGQELLNIGGFERIVDHDEFWEIVAEHAVG